MKTHSCKLLLAAFRKVTRKIMQGKKKNKLLTLFYLNKLLHQRFQCNVLSFLIDFC